MKYRDHRGGLAESMATMVEVATIDELAKHLSGHLMPTVYRADLVIAPYDPNPDERIGWPLTNAVLWRGVIVGFCDGDFGEQERVRA